MLYIFETLLPVFGIILFGGLIEHRRFMPESMALCLNQFVYWIGLPSLLFNQLARVQPGQVSFELIMGISGGMVVTFIVSQAWYTQGFRKRTPESTLLAFAASFPNAAFMGLPIVALLFPSNNEAMLMGSLTVVFSSLLLMLADVKLDVDTAQTSGLRAAWYFMRALIHNPLLLASCSGLIFSVFSIPFPKPLNAMTAMLGSTSAPCALFCIGMILSVQLSSTSTLPQGWLKHQLAVHGIKLLIQPIITWGLLVSLGVSGMALAVSILLSGMPIGVIAYVIAEKYRLSPETMSTAIVVNTILSVFSLPLLIAVLQYGGLL